MSSGGSIRWCRQRRGTRRISTRENRAGIPNSGYIHPEVSGNVAGNLQYGDLNTNSPFWLSMWMRERVARCTPPEDLWKRAVPGPSLSWQATSSRGTNPTFWPSPVSPDWTKGDGTKRPGEPL